MDTSQVPAQPQLELHNTIYISQDMETQKQPKCPTIDESIKKLYIYTMDYYSAIKNNKIMPFAATWMDPEIIILSKLGKDKYHVTSLICGILKNDTNELIYKIEIHPQTKKTSLW